MKIRFNDNPVIVERIRKGLIKKEGYSYVRQTS